MAAWDTTKGKGKAYQWLLAHVTYQGDDCIAWPFATDRGYGILGYNGEHGWAHRVMCVHAHGEPPTPEHEASHSCGNGDKGCMNQKHIAWKTKAGNQQDRRQHGTHGQRARPLKRPPSRQSISHGTFAISPSK